MKGFNILDVYKRQDVERIRAERRINTTFAANQANLGDKKAVSIATEFVNSKELTLTRKFNAHPFVPCLLYTS